MATQYTSLLGLALPVTGELSGSWGDVVNDSITSLLDSAVSGTTTLSADADVTLTTTDGAANQARQAILLWTATGTVTRNITAPAHSKAYFVINKTGGTQSIVIRGVGPTTGVTVRAGQQALVVWNGTDFVEVASGDVDGPSSATDNAVARFDGTTGKLIQNSAVTIDDSGNVSGVVQLNATTVDATNVEVTNIKAKDGTAAVQIADSTGVVSVTAAPVLTALTAGQAVFTNGSKALVSNAITGTGNVVMSTSPTLVTPALGTPASGVLTNATGLPIATGVSGLGSNVATFLATPSSANLASAVTDETGSGSLVFATSPTLVTPALGTPSALVGTNITGTAAGLTAGNVTTNANLTGAVTSVGNATSLGSFTSAQLAGALTDETGTGSAVFATSPTFVTPALGTPASGVLTNATGLPIATGVSGLGTGVATFLATPSSANLLTAVTDETGTGALVFATSPTLVTPDLGTPSALVGTNITGTASGLTAGNVTTNANLTGAITSVGNATSLGSFTSAQLAGALTDETGSGLAVFATSPTLVTPALGTPSSGVLTNATGLPISTGVSGLGTGVATALAVNVGTAGSPVVNGGVLGTPSSGTVTNLTGTASININGTVGATTPSTGAFTTLSSTGNTTLGDASADTVTINGTVQPGVVISGSSTGNALRITQTGTGNALLVEDSANPDATPTVIDASGRVVVGHTSPVIVSGSPSLAPTFEVMGTSFSSSAMAAIRYSADTGSPTYTFAKSRSATVGSFSTISNGDSLGLIVFDGDDGTSFVRGASITAFVDGTPGTNDMPGRLVLSTTADGASAPTERVRINSTGNVLVGTTTNTNSSLLVVNGEISETVDGVQYEVVSQADIGTAPNEIPLNQYLGNLAYQDAANIAGPVRVGGTLTAVGATTLAAASMASATVTNAVEAGGGAVAEQLVVDNFTASSNAVLRGGATNLLTYSEQFDDAAWTKTRSSITANTIVAPDGTLTGDKLVEDTTANNTHGVNQTFSFSTGSYVYSIYAKAGERTFLQPFRSSINIDSFTQIFNLAAGTVSGTGATIVSVGNGWYRCIGVVNVNTAHSGSIIFGLNNGTSNSYTGDGTSGLFIWGAQLNTGSAPAAYLKTVATAVSTAYAAPLESPNGLAFPLLATMTPARNADMTFELASDTSLVVKVKGSDGTVRSVTLTLA